MLFSRFDYVEVVLYDDGTYEVKDVDHFISSHFSDKRNGRDVDIFYCGKETWKFEVCHLINKEIERDKETIKQLKQDKKRNESLLKSFLEELDKNGEVLVEFNEREPYQWVRGYRPKNQYDD